MVKDRKLPIRNPRYRGKRKWLLDAQKIANADDGEHMCAYTVYPQIFLQTPNPSVLSFYVGKLKGLG